MSGAQFANGYTSHRAVKADMTTLDGGAERSIDLQADSPRSQDDFSPVSKKSTGVEPLDGLLGGGISPRSLVILAGAPGTRKSIL